MHSNRTQQPLASPTKEKPPSSSSKSSSSKDVSGLPVQKEAPNYYRDVHMDTAKGLTSIGGFSDIHMNTARGYTMAADDVMMATARGPTVKQGGGLQLWERELLDSSEVKRKATVAQLCESW